MNPGSRGHRVLRRAAARLVARVRRGVARRPRRRRARSTTSPPRKLHTIPNGIRLDRYAPDAEARAAARVELGLGDAWVVGTVGRLDDNKNQAMLVRAMAPLLSSRVRLVIVGEARRAPRVEAEVAQLPEPRWVVLTGRRMDVPRLVPRVRRVRAVVEDRGPAARRARGDGGRAADRDDRASAACPSVVDDGETGLLVPGRRGARSRRRSPRSPPIATRARAMGGAAREVALARYSSDRMVDAYLALYARATPVSRIAARCRRARRVADRVGASRTT